MKSSFDYGPVDAALRDVYASASRAQFTQRMRRLVVDSGVSRAMLHYRARKMGLRFTSKRKWTKGEDNYLFFHAGEMTVREMARQLNRGVDAVCIRLQRMRISARYRLGYSIEELAECTGACDVTIRGWWRRGWLRQKSGRFTPSSVSRFIREHLDEISFRRADEEWLKERLAECLTGETDDLQSGRVEAA